MKVSLQDDSLPKGTELFVRSLGKLVNGEVVEFSDEEVAAFEADREMSIHDAFKKDERIKIGSATASASKGGD